MIQFDYRARVKTVLAIGFVRLCVLLTLQIQMVSHVSADGSFNVQMLFAVLLVDGGGAITAVIFLHNNPIVAAIVRRIQMCCNTFQLQGPRTASLFWLGEEERQINERLRRSSMTTQDTHHVH